MTITLTPLATDFFNRANESPLASPWSLDLNGDPGLQVVSDACESTSLGSSNGQLYEYSPSTPNDQYASVEVGASVSNSGYIVRIRLIDNNSPFVFIPHYALIVSKNGTWSVRDYGGSGLILSGSGLAVSVGDVFALAAVGTTIYALRNDVVFGSVSNSSHSSGITALTIVPVSSVSDTQASGFAMGSATSGYAISGNCGAPSTTINYSGTASGSVTADGSGNYTIASLPNGTYVLTPSLAGFQFSQPSAVVVVNGVNITGVNFQAASAWSPVDSRITPNMNRVENNSIFWDVQTSDNASVPGKDSRANPPIDSDKNPPQNSRKAPPF